MLVRQNQTQLYGQISPRSKSANRVAFNGYLTIVTADRVPIVRYSRSVISRCQVECEFVDVIGKPSFDEVSEAISRRTVTRTEKGPQGEDDNVPPHGW